MKKNLLGIFTAGLLAMFVVSCDKEEQEPLETGTAKVSGKLTANLDASSLTNQAVPAGTGITFVIDGAALDMRPDPNFNYERITRRTTVDANGKYTISLPARQTPIDVDVIFDDFEYDATIITTDDNGFQTTVTARKVFTLPDALITIVDGKVEILDRTYNMIHNEFVDAAIIKGKIEAVFVDNIGEASNITVVNQGTGYSTGTNIAANGGSGSGLTVNITSVGAGGEVTGVNISDGGEGYQIGDVVTVSSGGGNATIEITGVDPALEGVPEGVVLTFITNNGSGKAFKTTTDADGGYVIHVPVQAGGDNIQVQFADFEYNSVFFENGSFVSGDKIYTRGTASISVSSNSIIEQDYIYNRAN